MYTPTSMFFCQVSEVEAGNIIGMWRVSQLWGHNEFLRSCESTSKGSRVQAGHPMWHVAPATVGPDVPLVNASECLSIKVNHLC